MPLPEFDTSFILLAACVALAGIARGMSGFGTGMIIAPVAGALYGPKTALVVIALIDTLPILPLAIPALKQALWREVLPVLAGLFVMLPAGIFLLTQGDPIVLRWLISAAILACVVALWSGWRYGGPRGPAVSLGIGGVAGVLSGFAGIPGPPVIIYWLASGLPGAIVRVNLLALFFLAEFVSLGNIWAAGLLTRGAVAATIGAMPFYFAGLLVGWRLFGLASERTYRRVTFVLIVMAALLALPVLDTAFATLAGWFA